MTMDRSVYTHVTTDARVSIPFRATRTFSCSCFGCFSLISLPSNDVIWRCKGSIITDVSCFNVSSSSSIGEARRMLRDTSTNSAGRDERRPSLLSHRGEWQGIGFILRHSDCQRYEPLDAVVNAAAHYKLVRLFFIFIYSNQFSSPLLRHVKVEPVSMATVIAVVIACLFLIIVVTLCLLYAYRSERCCFNRESSLLSPQTIKHYSN